LREDELYSASCEEDHDWEWREHDGDLWNWKNRFSSLIDEKNILLFFQKNVVLIVDLVLGRGIGRKVGGKEKINNGWVAPSISHSLFDPHKCTNLA